MISTAKELDVKGLISDQDRFAINDGPGIRMAVFLKGCSLQCLWCHSPESQSPEPELAYHAGRCIDCRTCLTACPEQCIAPGAEGVGIRIDRKHCTMCGRCTEQCNTGAIQMIGHWVTVGSLLHTALKDKVFYDFSKGGITLTGGEVLMQSEFAVCLLRAAARHGIHTAIETSGYAPWECLFKVAGAADLILYDLKVLDADLHRRYTGVDNRIIIDNLGKLRQRFPQKKIQVRVPCIPGVSATEDNIQATAALVHELNIESMALLPYNESASAKYQWLDRCYSFEDFQVQTFEEMALLRRVAEAQGVQAEICA